MTITASVKARPATLDADPSPHSLAAEHTALLRDVLRRTGPVSALLEAHVWPDAELRTLVRFLRTFVLRQASDEEALLYRNDAARAIGELHDGHARLRALTEQLDQAAAAPCTQAELRNLVIELLTALRRHLLAEQAALQSLPHAPPQVPSVAAVGADLQSWLPPDEEPVRVVLDALPQQQAVQVCLERLLRLRPDQSADVYARERSTLTRVCRWIQDFDSMGYGVTLLDADTAHPALRVTRRSTG